ncbi:histidine--tRNA ligase [Lachnospiraceae bacterium]|nr:histidine--tRNA ligase [Lachnospiraceae bacterium]
MAMKKNPVTGMKDVLPEEMLLRDYLIGIIKDTYRGFGFTPMETPCVEHIENLTSKQGGDNEKLIFKILKRGEKLKLEEATKEDMLTDSGLRYDLTLPLTRYYANNSAVLPQPFKALQIGSVWRADRPQRGRYRQFTQCDIDILGDATNLSEIELILATTTALKRICPDNGFVVRINERRILKALVSWAGFPEERADSVLVTLDKMDKIGEDGVRAELVENGCDGAAADRYLGLLKEVGTDGTAVRSLGEKLKEHLEPGTAETLAETMETVTEVSGGSLPIVFDPTLVRGMGYYTGTIFEVSMEGFSGSVAGGGRYDKMIGKFTGTDVPACGFSIGFERIIAILTDQKFKIPNQRSKKAFLYDKRIGAGELAELLREAKAERDRGFDVLVVRMAKNKKFQREQLTEQGYTEFKDFYTQK